MTGRPRSDEPRINRQISVPQVRLVDENGEMIGVVATAEAVRRAEAAGLDLVEVSPNAEPPVCKILDYGKYKYELQKKAHEARKKQKIIVVKEIQIRPTIEKNDFEVKVRNIHKFIDEGDKVRISLRFRGREITHNDIGFKLMQDVQEALGEKVKIESPPRLEGKQITMMVAPAK